MLHFRMLKKNVIGWKFIYFHCLAQMKTGFFFFGGGGAFTNLCNSNIQGKLPNVVNLFLKLHHCSTFYSIQINFPSGEKKIIPCLMLTTKFSFHIKFLIQSEKFKKKKNEKQRKLNCVKIFFLQRRILKWRSKWMNSLGNYWSAMHNEKRKRRRIQEQMEKLTGKSFFLYILQNIFLKI